MAKKLRPSVGLGRILKIRAVTPCWANKTAINRLYRQARKMRKSGLDVNVDHIVPLNHPYVSGLHCEFNLRIVYTVINRAKSNHAWPGCWHAPAPIAGIHSAEEPEQYALSIPMQQREV